MAVAAFAASCNNNSLTTGIQQENFDTSVKPGDTGVATTRLALIGYAEINGRIVEVKSDDGFIDEKTPVRVCRLADGVVFVTREQLP